MKKVTGQRGRTKARRASRQSKPAGGHKAPAASPKVRAIPALPKDTRREWDRGTEFLKWFAMSGFLAERMPDGSTRAVRPASVILVGTPGSGKTELLERFKLNRWISYHSDLTVRNLMPLLRRAQEGTCTHIGAPEFNKFFQRKLAIAENCIGLISVAMEEGVRSYDVGSVTERFDGARLGMFAGMTPGSLSKRRELLSEMGFISRACVIEWRMSREERDRIMDAINRGDTSDLEPVTLDAPKQRVVMVWDQAVGEALQDYVRECWPQNDLRLFQRFRTLLMSAALSAGRSQVLPADMDRFMQYRDYWERMVVDA